MNTAQESLVSKEEISRILATVPVGYYVGGRWVGSDGGAISDEQPTLDVINPATGAAIAKVCDAAALGAADDASQCATLERLVKQTLDAAVAAGAEWAATPPRQRAEVLRRIWEVIEAHEDELAVLMTLEMGKPLAEARGEVHYAAEFFRWFSEECCRIDGRYTEAPAGGNRFLVMKQPVGPVYAVTPWNFPLAMATRKLAPALAAGCPVVLKPAANTPLTALYFMRLLDELVDDSGNSLLPKGLVSCIVTSDPAALTRALFNDGRIRKLTFTGSTGVGRRLLAEASERVLRTSMELGGNAPFVVLHDADVDAAVSGAMLAKFRNNGEACTGANRFFVHRDVAEEFAAKFAAAAGELVVGDGLVAGVTCGPLINEAGLAKVRELAADCVAKGARVLCGWDPAGDAVGELPSGGFFFPPTVVLFDAETTEKPRVLDEEIFGPLAPIFVVDSDEEAIARANDSEFGLISYVYSQDVTCALAAVEKLESGMVALNSGVVSNPAAPFGGVKQSGLGREGSHEGIDEYLELKYVGFPL